MISVLLLSSWTYPDVMRQSPGSMGIWNDISVTRDIQTPADYVVVSNYSQKREIVQCVPGHMWCLLQEPPNEFFGYWHRASSLYDRVFTQDASLHGDRYIHTQPAIAWQVQKTYDELKNAPFPEKQKDLSWITSLKDVFSGHRDRLLFLSAIKKHLSFDLIATHQYHEAEKEVSSSSERKKREIDLKIQGYDRVVEGKWEGISPYRYSLIIENFSGPHYWSEKLADCFLSWTIPIYYGCTNISTYFPEDSYIPIDIKDANVFSKLQDIVKHDQWQKRLKALKKARNLILDQYQLFPFLYRHIHHKTDKIRNTRSSFVVIPDEWTLKRKIGYYTYRLRSLYS